VRIARSMFTRFCRASNFKLPVLSLVERKHPEEDLACGDALTHGEELKPATLITHAHSSTIPIVAAIVADPIGVGFAAALERPGGNITGITSNEPSLRYTLSD
jgi:hypothetical protein